MTVLQILEAAFQRKPEGVSMSDFISTLHVEFRENTATPSRFEFDEFGTEVKDPEPDTTQTEPILVIGIKSIQ